MTLFFYNVTWPCDSDCNMSVLYDDCYTLSWYSVPFIFKIREKEEKKTQDRKSSSKK